MTGGSGSASREGSDGSVPIKVFENTPVEVNEVEAGIKVHRYGLVTDLPAPANSWRPRNGNDLSLLRQYELLS